jgi:hypothetical protein
MNDIDVFDVPKPKLKLFGERAVRVTTAEMNAVFEEIQQIFSSSTCFRRMDLSKPLPSKEDHGDVDIVIEKYPSVDNKTLVYDILFYNSFGSQYLIETDHNGPIMHCLFNSKCINKQVHVDFIFASSEEYNSTLMYLAYNDFSGILGVFTRKLKFNYGNKGIFKIYVDKKGQYHYILLSHNLVDGLRMLGYADIIHKYYTIQNNDDIAAFIGHSDLFDSSNLIGNDLNRGDRKRMRAGRPSARDLKGKLIALNKSRSQPDDDYYLKNLFPDKYADYLGKCKAIEDYVPPKSKYNGHWLINNFGIKPGPVIKQIQLYWLELYGEDIDSVDEERIRIDTYSFIKDNKIEV